MPFGPIFSQPPEEEERSLDFLGPVGSFLGGALGGFLQGRGQARQQRQEFQQRLALDRALNPNRPLTSALRRNLTSNILANLRNLGGPVTTANFPGFISSSLTGGVHPLLLQELQNIAVPGLRVGGKLIGEDPEKFFRPSGPGFLESLGLGLASVLGR